MRNKNGNGGFPTGHDENIGKKDFAGMPSDVKMVQYPKTKQMRGGMLDDTMDDIDEVASGSEARQKRYLSNQK